MASTFKQSIEESNSKIKEIEEKLEQINMQTQYYNQRPMYAYPTKSIPEEKQYSMMGGMMGDFSSSEIPFAPRMNKAPMSTMEPSIPQWSGVRNGEFYAVN